MSDLQLLTLLKFALFISPVAVYFLVLGLMNSHAHPRVVGGRKDFLTLMVCFTPMVAWMLQVVVRVGPGGHAWWLMAVLLLAGAVAVASRMPSDLASWVVYNASPDLVACLLSRAFLKQGIHGRWDGSELQLDAVGPRVRLVSFGLLRNVTIHLESTGQADRPMLERARRDFENALGDVPALPNVVGAVLLLIGSLMLVLPLTMMAGHMDTIVQIVHNYFS